MVRLPGCAAAGLILLAAGCAAGPVSGPFVKKSGRFVEVGAPRQAASPEAARELERVRREAVAKRAAEPRAVLPSIEGTDPALRTALAALGRVPSAAAHLRVASEYPRLGILDIAYDHYSDALAIEPESGDAYEARARLWRDIGILAPALTDAYRAKYYAPESAEIRNTLGTILEGRGWCQAALEQYREALRLRPGADWAQRNIARLSRTCS